MCVPSPSELNSNEDAISEIEGSWVSHGQTEKQFLLLLPTCSRNSQHIYAMQASSIRLRISVVPKNIRT